MEIPTIPVEEGVRLMVGDLERGRRFDKAVLLFAVYKAETTRAQAESLLEARLGEMGFRIERVRFPLEGEPDWPYWLRFHPPDGDSAFFVYNLRRAFPEILQYLNYRREIFAEERVRAVFWVLEEEARRLALEAPDFWAFRTQVLELLEVPPPRERAEIARELAWWGWYGVPYAYESPEEIEERIVLRERLLAELPETEEATAARAEMHYTLGGLYWARREFEQALEYFRQALELARQLGDERLVTWAHNGLGNVYYDLGRYEEAIAEYERAIELDPKLPYPHNGLGNAYRQLGRYEEAIAEYERAIELDSKYAYPYNGLGSVYGDLGRYEEAIAEYKKAIELDPKYPYPYDNLADIYTDQGRYDEAIELYQKSLELQPRAAPHNSLGIIYYYLDRCQEAMTEFQRAIELDPKGAGPYHGLGNVYYELGRYDEAILTYKKAIDLNPKRATHHISLAATCRKLGKEEEFAKHGQRARKLLDPDEHYNWARLESISGNTEKALEHLKLALEKEAELKEWAAKRDSDLEWIREDERFWELLEMSKEVASS